MAKGQFSSPTLILGALLGDRHWNNGMVWMPSCPETAQRLVTQTCHLGHQTKDPHTTLSTRPQMSQEAALFRTAHTWKYSKCPPTGEWINIQWNALLSNEKEQTRLREAITGMNPKIRSWVKEEEHKKPHNVWLYLCELSRRGKAMETESRWDS